MFFLKIVLTETLRNRLADWREGQVQPL